MANLGVDMGAIYRVGLGGTMKPSIIALINNKVKNKIEDNIYSQTECSVWGQIWGAMADWNLPASEIKNQINHKGIAKWKTE